MLDLLRNKFSLSSGFIDQMKSLIIKIEDLISKKDDIATHFNIGKPNTTSNMVYALQKMKSLFK